MLALSSSAVTILVRQASATPLAPRAIRVRKSYLVWYQNPATMPRTWKGSSRPMASRLWLKLASRSLRRATRLAALSICPDSAVMRALWACHHCSKAARMATSLATRPALVSMVGLRACRLSSAGAKS
ncbi:hypothetical protein D3C76_1514920 [compost metagenome]